MPKTPEDDVKILTNAEQGNFNYLDALQKSFTSNNRNLYKYCYECKFKTFLLSTLGKHVMLHDTSRKYACIGCGFRYRKSYHLKRHMKTCRSAKEKELPKLSPQNQIELDIYKCCNECEFKTFSLSFLERHKMLHDKSRKYICVSCGLRYSTRHSQNRHMEICRFARDIKLEKQSSQNQSELDTNKYCNECKFKTFSLSDLEKHKILHDKSRKYLCGSCGLRYPTRHNQKRHMERCRLATNIVPQNQSSNVQKKLICNKYYNECNFKTFSLSALEKHILFHDKSRKYVCVSCGFRFPTRYNQKRHMKTCRLTRNELDSY